MADANPIEQLNPETVFEKTGNVKVEKKEQGSEVRFEQKERGLEKKAEQTKMEKEILVDKNIKNGTKLDPIIKKSPSFQERRAKEIDNILSSGLHEVFLQLDKKRQAEFKLKGEETVSKINGLLNESKIRIDKIISLIKKWLKLIPGINQFFLEQEAKIKADKIVDLKNKA